MYVKRIVLAKTANLPQVNFPGYVLNFHNSSTQSPLGLAFLTQHGKRRSKRTKEHCHLEPWYFSGPGSHIARSRDARWGFRWQMEQKRDFQSFVKLQTSVESGPCTDGCQSELRKSHLTQGAAGAKRRQNKIRRQTSPNVPHLAQSSSQHCKNRAAFSKRTFSSIVS